MITVVDYGMGNLGSVLNMLKKIGASAKVATNAEDIYAAEKLILPGVGAFDAAIERIDRLKLREALNDRALRAKIPVLGICLGMQLLTESSEEGSRPGLGWIKAKTRGFKNRINTDEYKIPHIGWNETSLSTPSELTKDLSEMEDLRYYFVHSYFVTCEEPQNSILKTEYCVVFDSAIQRDNVYGVQFHPEKSHRFGMALFRNFAAL